MSDDKQASGLPQISVLLPGEFGAKKQEPEKIDSNRLDPVGEGRRLARYDLAIPGRWEDAVLQACSWICGSAVVMSFLRTFPIAKLAGVVGLFCMVAAAIGHYRWSTNPELRFFIGYRTFLIITGVAIACV
jgi:hypothetical protein